MSRRKAVIGTIEGGALTVDFGSCQCCAEYGLIHVPANHLDGLCALCRSRSIVACQRAHKKEAAS